MVYKPNSVATISVVNTDANFTMSRFYVDKQFASGWKRFLHKLTPSTRLSFLCSLKLHVSTHVGHLQTLRKTHNGSLHCFLLLVKTNINIAI